MNQKRTNKIMIFILAMSLMITVMIAVSISASAEEHTHTHTDWTAITDTLPTTAGNYYLTQDITTTTGWTVDADITICFNGHNIILNADDIEITVNTGKILTLCNCLDTNNSLSKTTANTNSKYVIINDGTLNIYDVTITSQENVVYNDSTNSITNIYSGVIECTGTKNALASYGTTNIYGGTIKSAGKAIYNYTASCVLNMTNGEVISTGDDALYHYKGTANISGGTITSSKGNAIDAALSTANLNISGSAYIYTTYKSSYAIYFCGTTFKLSGNAVIEHTNNNSVVYINSSSCTNVDITGGTIQLTKSSDKNNRGLYISAKNADVNISDCIIKTPSATNMAVYGFSYNTLSLSGNVSITYIYLQNGVITLSEDGFTTDNPIPINTGATKPAAITAQNTKDYSGNFVSNDSKYKIYNDNNTVMIGTAVSMSGTLSLDGETFVGKTLTASYTAGSDNETVSYQWYRDDVAISGANSTSYTTTMEDNCKTIKVIVSGTGLCTGQKEASVYVIPGYPVNLNANGGNCELTVLYADDSGKISELPTPTRSGFTFNGWYDAKTNGNKISVDDVYTHETTIYAQWTLISEYTIDVLLPYDVSSTYKVDFIPLLPNDVSVKNLSVTNPAAAIVYQTSPAYSTSRADMTLKTNVMDKPTSGNVIVEIGTNNYGTITFTLKVCVVDFEIASFNSTTNSADITFKQAGTYTVIFADYDGQKLENVEAQEITIAETSIIPVSITKGFTLDKDDKIMLWSDMTNLVPLCEAYIVE